MKKIFNAPQIRDIDAATVAEQCITSFELMERAATRFLEAVLPLLNTDKDIYIFAGAGNNGGDALAVSRMLCTKAYRVKTYLVAPEGKLSPDCETNKKRLSAISSIWEIMKTEDIPNIPPDCFIIDGLFGSGLNRPVSGLYKEVVGKINISGAMVLSIDIPSGMFVEDNNLNTPDAIVQADYVFTFQYPKLALLLPDSSPFCETFFILDIGLSGLGAERNESSYFFIEKEDAAKIIKPRKKFAHKGDFGKAYIISGSYGKMGAAVMSAQACLRTGVGLLTMHVPQCGMDVIQTAVPEAMVNADNGEKYSYCPEKRIADYTLGIGPGLGVNEETTHLLAEVLENYRKPMVADADALNILSKYGQLKAKLPHNSILTPHPVEFDRLLGKECKTGYDRLQNAREFAALYNVYIVLKGAYTAVVTPGKKVYFNSTGNPGMATGGSGDVLTGILTSLLAQKYSPEDACILGVYLHGLAGNLAAECRTEESMLATDIVKFLGKAFHVLFENTGNG